MLSNNSTWGGTVGSWLALVKVMGPISIWSWVSSGCSDCFSNSSNPFPGCKPRLLRKASFDWLQLPGDPQWIRATENVWIAKRLIRQRLIKICLKTTPTLFIHLRLRLMPSNVRKQVGCWCLVLRYITAALSNHSVMTFWRNSLACCQATAKLDSFQSWRFRKNNIYTILPINATKR